MLCTNYISLHLLFSLPLSHPLAHAHSLYLSLPPFLALSFSLSLLLPMSFALSLSFSLIDLNTSTAIEGGHSASSDAKYSAPRLRSYVFNDNNNKN